MIEKAANASSQSSAHTRKSIFGAFLHLLFDRRYDTIRTIDLINQAGIGRSTFYEHFSSKDEVLLATFDPVLLPLANAASGRASRAALSMMLEHVWERRALGRIILDSSAAPKLRRRLAAMIEQRLALEHGDSFSLALPAAAAAVGQLTILRMWVAGEVSCKIDDLVHQLMAFAQLPVQSPDSQSGTKRN